MKEKGNMATATSIEDKFGFLTKKWIFAIEDIDIFPVDNFNEAKNYVEENKNIDSYYYPPMIHRVKIDPISHKPIEKIPKTERPAHLFRLPSSHIIKIKNTDQDIEKLRTGAAGFLIHLLGYLFGCRLQFCDWWVDNRVPMKSQHGVILNRKEVEEFLHHAFNKWKSWSSDKQHLFTNLLFMHTRTSGYEWEWERFMMEYIVFDGCWKFYAESKNFKVGHRERFKKILGDFGMAIHQDKIKKIVDLRNQLFHETLWEGNQPGAHASNDAFYSHMWLQSINQRLFPALLNYDTKYIKSDWTYMGTLLFKS
jgi:hypothetical protein